MTYIQRRWYPLAGAKPARRGAAHRTAKKAQTREPIDPLTGPKLALAGRVVTMDSARTVIQEGVLWIAGSRIAAVTSAIAPTPAGFADIAPLPTNSTLYPGLIELHNHLCYNILTLWQVPKLYSNRDQWPSHKDYSKLISGPMGTLGSIPEQVAAISRYTEAKCLLGGVTTSQGITIRSFSTKRYYKGIIRNVEASLDKLLPAARAKIGDVKADTAQSFLKSISKKSCSCFLLHLSEGRDAHARQRFLDLKFGNDSWAIAPSLCGIHAAALKPEDFQIMAEHGASMVWSPSSNLMLYGATADVAAATAAGVRVSLGCDWSPSGSRNLLAELKIARAAAQAFNTGLTSRDIVAMVTSTPAAILRWGDHLGTLVAENYADVIAVKGTTGDPYDHLINADESDLRLVMIGGRSRLADPVLDLIPAANVETISVGAATREVDFEDADSDPLVAGLTLAGAEARLKDALQRLPELAADVLAPKPMSLPALAKVNPRNWFLDLDQEEFVSFNPKHRKMKVTRTVKAAALAKPAQRFGPPLHMLTGFKVKWPKKLAITKGGGKLQPKAKVAGLVPLQLDKLTVAGDKDYWTSLKAEMNIPKSVKDLF